jgi:hypothetical protein
MEAHMLSNFNPDNIPMMGRIMNLCQGHQQKVGKKNFSTSTWYSHITNILDMLHIGKVPALPVTTKESAVVKEIMSRFSTSSIIVRG